MMNIKKKNGKYRDILNFSPFIKYADGMNT